MNEIANKFLLAGDKFMSKYDEYQKGLASMVYIVFDKKSKGSGINDEIKQNQTIGWRMTQANY